MNYYNEFDPKAALWLRNLITAGFIPSGDVDERSITEVKADELKGYAQCHFFAGIGGWPYALQLAGWPTDRPVWTGSCPCQPFSSAGKKKGKDDERHLWPVWFSLIRQSRPTVVFGEQVSSAIRHGWWDDAADDLEREGYTTRAEIRPACSVGAPHKRDRLWFLANTESTRSCGAVRSGSETVRRPTTGDSLQLRGASDECSNVAYADCAARRKDTRSAFGNEEADGCARRFGGEQNGDNGFTGHGEGTTADTELRGCEREPFKQCTGIQQTMDEATKSWKPTSAYGSEYEDWHKGQWIDCPDGKQRLIEPSIPLLAYGVSARVAQLRGLGNAIVPQVAAEFIKTLTPKGANNG